MTPYLPPKYSQGDGSTWQWSNCVLAVTTDLIDRATVGALRIPASRLRTVTGDTSGGVTHSQAASAAYKATNGRVRLYSRVITRAQMRDLGEAGIAFGVFMHTRITKDTRFRTNAYIGLHELYVQDYDESDDSFLVEDPGTTQTGYQWMPASLLFRAAEYAGNGSIYVLTCQDTEDVNRVAIQKARIRATPDPDGVDKGPVVVGRTYWVSKTANGEMWQRDDGGQSNGWHRVNGGWIKGEALR